MDNHERNIPLIQYLKLNYKDVEVKKDSITFCHYIAGRVISYYEENKIIEEFKKQGITDVEVIVRTAGITKFKISTAVK